VSERSSTLLAALVLSALATAALVVGGTVGLVGAVAAHVIALVGTASSCAVSLSDTRIFPLTMIVPISLGLTSTVSFARAVTVYRRERQLLRSLPLDCVATGALAEIARTTGVRLYTTPASRPAAFCFGLLRPRVVFTSGLVERLSEDEQAAAFWHEAQHARVREPLRCLLARIAASTFFWLPMLRDLLDRYTLVRELDADRLATTKTSRQALAGALEAVVAAPAYAGAVGFADFAAARVDRLLDPQEPLPSIYRRSRVAVSVAAVALLGLAFTYPANVPVSNHVHQEPMMMKVPVVTPTGVTWLIVPCE
jgi:beta-lactamase regulating signal transducer with metallopeptidase domain